MNEYIEKGKGGKDTPGRRGDDLERADHGGTRERRKIDRRRGRIEE